MARRTRERDQLLIAEAEIARRTPSSAEGSKVPSILEGLVVEVPKVDHELEAAVIAAAAETVRIFNGKQYHKCTRKKKSDPPCTDPKHWKDVALMRGDLMKLGLPGELVGSLSER